MKRILFNLVFIVGLISNPLVASAEDCDAAYEAIKQKHLDSLIASMKDGEFINFGASTSGDVCGKTYSREEYTTTVTSSSGGTIIAIGTGITKDYVDGNLIVYAKVVAQATSAGDDQILELIEPTFQDYERLWGLLGVYGYGDTPTATVLEVTGQTFSLTTVDAQIPAVSGTIPDIGALLTLDNSSIKIQRNDGTIVASKAKTVTVLSPAVESDNSIALIRGEVTSTVNCTDAGDYEVRTIAADIKVIGSCGSTQRASSNTEFTAKYGQSGSNGTLTVNVASGTVKVTDKNDITFTLNAGEEKTIQYRVPRADWVLPVDNDILRGGKDNLLVWKEFPGASSYQMEFNLPAPVFAEENANRPEYQKQVIPLPSNSYAKVDGDLIAFNLPIPKGADELVIELRIFALDAAGNIIGESVSSDRSTVTVTD
ncbi:MAG: FecR family protein [gamma proteobacterium symbiont of Taylorina sp.]|nr:FecR family protein [gamma proteobacterium symbiont of Taylorina sp.]